MTSSHYTQNRADSFPTQKRGLTAETSMEVCKLGFLKEK